MTMPTKKAARKPSRDVKQWYKDHLAEKDKEIKELKKENAILLAIALKQGVKTKEIFERAKNAMKKKSL